MRPDDEGTERSSIERLIDAKTIAPIASVLFLIALTVLIVRRSATTDSAHDARPAPPPPSTRVPQGYYYRVQSGDTLERIAKRVYHDSRAWRPIAVANRIGDPRRLRAGKLIWIPAITVRHGTRPIGPANPRQERRAPPASTAPRVRTRE